MEHQFVAITLFFAFFLLMTSIAYQVTRKFSFMPYTVLLLILGLIVQFVSNIFTIHVNVGLSHDVIYYLLLPILLFESAYHIKLHQFRLQFKTISFFATFGLLVSVFVVAMLLTVLAGFSFRDALLFGAIISATDPIAVISMFKSLGAPRRLALVADGESMLNDATGVIAFRIVSAFVLAGGALSSSSLAGSIFQFIYIFIGSIVFGLLVGYGATRLLAKSPNDRIIVTSLTFVFALGSFVLAEVLFHLSGVISSVLAGIVIGNYGRTTMSSKLKAFQEEIMEYLAFLSVSLVFFFATYSLDLSIFIGSFDTLLIVIFATLVARSLSVYGSAFVSNRISFFADEPNIPLSWQHILNWGGLRGVIPLVLVYSLPRDYELFSEMLVFTLGTFLFTLLVNGLTIRSLLMKLGLHARPQEEEIMHEEKIILDLEHAQEVIASLNRNEIDSSIIKKVRDEIVVEEVRHKDRLTRLATPKELEKCISLQTLDIERDSLERLYKEGYITENVFYDFEAQLDLQQDAVEYPEVYEGRGFEAGGKIRSQETYRKKVNRIKKTIASSPYAFTFLKESKKRIITNRISLLKARVTASKDVLVFLSKMTVLFSNNESAKEVLKSVHEKHTVYIKENTSELEEIIEENKELYIEYQRNVAKYLLHMA